MATGILDLLLSGALAGGIAATAALGVVALPWSREELGRSIDALWAIPDLARAGARALGSGGPAPRMLRVR